MARELSEKEIEGMDRELRDNGVTSWKFLQDERNVYVAFTLNNGRVKSLSFAKVENGQLSDNDLDSFCNAQIVNYLKHFSKAKLRSFFTNKRWLVECYELEDLEDNDNFLEDKLQSLEDDGYEIRFVFDGCVIAHVHN